MPDPISTVLSTVSEHPQAVAAVASIYGVVKPFLAKILGPGADEIGEIGRDYIKGRRARNAKKVLEEAEKMIAKVGREPNEVAINILIPLLEAASLEENDTLTQKWAALLANAADSSTKKPNTRTAFVEILKQLSINDARTMRSMFNFADKDNPVLKANFDKDLLANKLTDFRTKNILEKFIPASLADAGMMPDSVFDNLLRLRLIEKVDNPPDRPSHYFDHSAITFRPSFDNVIFTKLGVEFMYACTAPNE